MFRRVFKSVAPWFALSVALGQSTQPVPFSHQTHIAAAKLTCTDCHAAPAKFGDTIPIPDAPACLQCHAYSQNQTSTREILNGFAEKKQPIPWVRVFALRGFVFFDHRYHLMNGAQCEDCHGSDAAQNATKMDFCQPCHVKSGAKTGCTTCHDSR
jgi:hypothetical protein